MAEETSFKLKCAFCGKDHEFPKGDLYGMDDNNQRTIKQKFCIQCGEPLVKFCPNCNTGILIEPNIKNTRFFKIDKAFNEPTFSILDDLIPGIKQEFEDYKKLAIKLNPEEFRLNQPEYLKIIPKVMEKISTLSNILKKIKQHNSNIPRLDTEKTIDSLLKDLEKSMEKCKDVQGSILPEKQLVDDKMDKKLRKKRLKVLDWEEDFLAFWNYVKEFREKQIKAELDSYKPGKDRIENYLLANPNNYRLECPTCKTKIYTIQKQTFVFGKSGKDYGDAFDLNELLGEERVEKDTSSPNTHTFDVSIIISKPGGNKYTLHGKTKFVLPEGEEKIVGRNYIREILYDEPIADEILFDSEEDILQMVSRSQMNFFKEDGKLKLKGLEYDPRRIGTFYNDLSNDIRETSPEGVSLTSGDKIIVPLTSEENNENRVEMILL